MSTNLAPARDSIAGQTLGPLRLRYPLGRGGFAPVWLAEESFGGRRLRDVAVKLFFLPDALTPGSAGADRWYESMAEEARAICRVEHPNVVRFYALHRDDARGRLGLCMEYVPGPSLEEVLVSAGRLDERTTVEVGISIAWALSSVHDAGLVHRDVKPANVIRGPLGYKLIDFGIFAPIHHEREAPRSSTSPRLHDDEQTEPDHAELFVPAGTPGYIAPECLHLCAPPTSASDLYSLGVTLFRLLTGSLPTPAGPDGDTAHGAVALYPEPAHVSGLRELIELLLRPAPLTRPRHADWVARQLERIIAEQRNAARRSFPPPPRESLVAPMSGPTVALPQPDPTMRTAFETAPEALPNLRVHPPLVGRHEPLATLGRAAEGVRRGFVHLSLLTGPMGIGRTRALDAAIEQADFGPIRVLRARCAPEQRQPLRPIIDALGALPSEGASNLGLLVDAVEHATAPGQAADEASIGGAPALYAGKAIEGIEEALLEASAEAPLLLAIDDLQWADPATLQLLVQLAGRAGERGRLWVLAAARDEPQPSPSLSALLARIGASVRPALRRLRLLPLSFEEARLVVQGVGPCSQELSEVIARGVGGVPALIVHALLAWREIGAIAWRSGAFCPVDERALREDVPGVADLLEARIDACFEPGSPIACAARRALACVALHGGDLDLDIVVGVLGKVEGGERAQEALDALLAAGILELAKERRELGFAQEMVRQAALNVTRQKPWFNDVYRALLDTVAARRGAPADAGFLAKGYERVGEARKARKWLPRAMAAAEAAGLFEETALLGDRLAALTPDPQRRRRVEIDIVRMAIRGRIFESARQRLDGLAARVQRLDALDVERRICRLEVERGLGEDSAGDPTLVADADALGDKALACEARLALAGVSPTALGLALAGEASALAADRGRALEFAARVRRLEINRGADRCDGALAEEDLRRALAIAAASGSAWHRIHIEGDLAILEADVGHTETAIARLRRLAEEAGARRMRGQQRLLLQNLSALLLRVGRCEEAAEAAGKAADLAANAGDPSLRARALSVRADALLRLGAREDALSCADEAAALQERLGDARRALTLLRRAEILEMLGRVEQALADAGAARRVAEEHGEVDLGLSARLWEVLRLARRGAAGLDAVERALAEAKAAHVTRRALTLRLMGEAEAYLGVLRAGEMV